MTRRRSARSRLRYEWRITLLALLSALPPLIAFVILGFVQGLSPSVWWTLGITVVLFTAALVFILREQLTYPLRTLSNLLGAIREEDYSFRARGARADDALGEVMLELNELSDTLREQRLEAFEATALVREIISDLDSAIFAFDGASKLRLVNPAGEVLLDCPAERLLGSSDEEIGLADLFGVEETRTIDRAFPGASGRWAVRHSTVRQKGRIHRLLVVSDLSRPLREEERLAWQRLLRVIGHELNNSLAPIKSIASSLEGLFAREPLPDDWREDARRGLEVIASRTAALTRFMEAYSLLARLPQPKLASVEVGSLVRRVAALERRRSVEVRPGPDLTLQADADQLEQLLINLLQNAVDAAKETGGNVMIGWSKRGSTAEILVEDEGPGISGSSNLFVPFYTTKPGGTGIGLVLSRQIAEAHGGTLTLENRSQGPGCAAKLDLPLRARLAG